MKKNTYILIIIALIIASLVAWFYMERSSRIPASSQETPDTTNTAVAPNTEEPANSMPSVTSGENPRSAGGIYNTPAEPAAVAARAALAAKLDVSAGSIDILSVKEDTWNNGCLGLAKPDEFCTEVLVDGFRVELIAQGKTYVYRTDKTGSNLRLEK